jgi:lysophospholipase L1-like esterase
MSSTKRGTWPRRLLALALGLLLLPLALEGLLALGALLRPEERAGAGGPALVLCQGDSNVFGYSLDPQLAFPAQLERLLAARGVEPARVVNRGVPGKPTWVVREELEADLARFAPRALVVLCGINDRNMLRPEADALGLLGRLRGVRLVRRLLARAEEGAVGEWSEPPPAANVITRDAVEPLDRESGRVRVQDRAGEVRPFVIRHGVPESALYQAWIADDLVAIAARARAEGVVPIACAYPLDVGPFASVNDGIEAGAARAGLALVDPRPAFAAALERLPQSELVFPDGHPTALGYGILARLLYGALVEAGLAPGPAPDPLEELAGRAPTALALEPVREGGRVVALLATYSPGHEIEILLARATGATPIRWRGAVVAAEEGEPHHKVVPLARDALFEATWRAPAPWTAAFDASGEARFALPPELVRSDEPLFASAVVVAPGSRIVAVAEPVRLR